jgi:hypothetical protein
MSTAAAVAAAMERMRRQVKAHARPRPPDWQLKGREGWGGGGGGGERRCMRMMSSAAAASKTAKEREGAVWVRAVWDGDGGRGNAPLKKSPVQGWRPEVHMNAIMSTLERLSAKDVPPPVKFRSVTAALDDDALRKVNTRQVPAETSSSK